MQVLLLGQIARAGGRFVARMSIGRDFEVDEEGMVKLRLLAYRLPLLYQRMVNDPLSKGQRLARYGFRRIKRAGIAGELSLVVQWLEGMDEPWLLLTSEPVRT